MRVLSQKHRNHLWDGEYWRGVVFVYGKIPIDRSIGVANGVCRIPINRERVMRRVALWWGYVC